VIFPGLHPTAQVSDAGLVVLLGRRDGPLRVARFEGRQDGSVLCKAAAGVFGAAERQNTVAVGSIPEILGDPREFRVPTRGINEIVELRVRLDDGLQVAGLGRGAPFSSTIARRRARSSSLIRSQASRVLAASRIARSS